MQRRWNIAVSSATDQALRVFLAKRGGGRKGYLSRIIEQAVTPHIKHLSCKEGDVNPEKRPGHGTELK